MRSIVYFLVSLLVVAFFHTAEGQQLKENEVVVIKGTKYVLHQVRTSETIYSISRQFKVDTRDIIKNNPEVKKGLKIGDILKIPYKDNIKLHTDTGQIKGDPSSFEYHIISSRKETPYFIAKKYNITVEEIYAYNPGVKRFKKGIKIRIPKWEKELKSSRKKDQKIDDVERLKELIIHEVKSGETIYSLSKMYNVSESEIVFCNPGVQKSLKKGSIIYIPKSGRAEKYVSEEIEKDLDEDFEMLGRNNFFEHTIVSGETLWSVSRKYNVAESELILINPVLKESFSAGVSIKIPLKKEEIKEVKPVNEEAFIKHVVLQGETIYGLASKYKLSISELKKFNVQLEKRNLVKGETILIPRLPDNTIRQEKDESDSLRHSWSRFSDDYYEINQYDDSKEKIFSNKKYSDSSAVYNIAMFLPLYIYENDTLNSIPKYIEFNTDSLLVSEKNSTKEDSLVEVDEPKKVFHGFYRESENFMEFYEGALLAVDSMTRAGMNVRLNVFDTQQDLDSLRGIIYSEQFLNFDLIIGPVFPGVQDEVSDICAKNRIPIVSPLSSQSRKISSNPYYFQVNPTRDYLTLKTAEYIVDEYYNSNFIVVKTLHSQQGQIENQLIDKVREKMLHSGLFGVAGGMQFNIYDFHNEGAFGLRRVLKPDKQNVIFIASMKEGDLSVVLSNINNLVDDYPITLIGFNRYEQFHSISEEIFHNLNLQYLAPYWVDYDHPATIKFLDRFKKYFYTEPGNFGMQGYDVTFYFLSALFYYGKDFNEYLPYHYVHLNQGNYYFDKISRFGGYMNQGVSVISYQHNFDVVRKRIIRSPSFVDRYKEGGK